MNKVLRSLSVGLALLGTAAFAEPYTCGVPLDVLNLSHGDQESLRMIFQEAGLDGQAGSDHSALSQIWTTWNDAALGRAGRGVTSIQSLAFKEIVPDFPIRFRLIYDTSAAVEKVNRGEWALAWVRGDILNETESARKDHVREVAYGRTYFDNENEETYQLVARKQTGLPQLGLLDKNGMKRAKDLFVRKGLRLAYGPTPEEALRPLREAHIDPFAAGSSLSPRLYVHKGIYDLDTIEEVIGGEGGRPGVDIAAVEPGDWSYFAREKPGRARRFVEPIWKTSQFVLLVRKNEGPKGGFDLDSPETARFLKHARLGVYLTKGAEAFTKAMSVNEVGRKALAKQVLPPLVSDITNHEDVLDDLVDGNGFDVVLIRKAVLDVYAYEKPGRFRRLEVIARLPPVLPPVLIANPDLVSESDIRWLQDRLVAFNWRDGMISTYLLFRGFGHFSLPNEVRQ